jgi:hypothetical protein
MGLPLRECIWAKEKKEGKKKKEKPLEKKVAASLLKIGSDTHFFVVKKAFLGVGFKEDAGM